MNNEERGQKNTTQVKGSSRPIGINTHLLSLHLSYDFYDA
jgi:hypothetical protein